jgi:ketosteroid isomerase-like protein
MRTLSMIVLLGSLAACADPPPPAATPDLDAIRDTVLELENQMNLAVDATECGMPEIGDLDPLFVGNGSVVRTRSELSEVCQAMVAPRTDAVFDADRITAHVLSPESALVVREGNYTINYKDGESETVYLVMSTVWQRGAQGWKMVHLHESTPLQPAGN